MAKIRVLLADDHACFREGLAAILNRFEGIEVVATAGDGAEAVQQARTARPDVVIMDVNMPGLNGLEAMRQLLTQQPEARVLILTAYTDSALVAQAIEAGAHGYILKDIRSVEVVNAIRSVYRGEDVLASAVAGRLAAEYRRLAQARQPGPMVTDRERQMLQLIAHGQTNREISGQMNLALQTVKNSLSVLFHKLGVTNRAEAVARAIRQGWIVPPAMTREDELQRSAGNGQAKN
jgi:NarL family two-component system response regulator LiaR